MKILDILYNAAFTFAFYVLIFRSLWYEVARLTNYILIKILDENKKYKLKSKKVKLERSRIEKFFYKDISIFPYAKQARETATFITIMLIIILFSHFLYVEFSEAITDPFLKGLYPMIIAIIYIFIFSILLCWDILLFLVNRFLISKNKVADSKELYIKKNLLKTDIKEKIYDILKGIIFVIAFLFITAFLARLTNNLPSKSSVSIPATNKTL